MAYIQICCSGRSNTVPLSGSRASVVADLERFLVDASARLSVDHGTRRQPALQPLHRSCHHDHRRHRCNMYMYRVQMDVRAPVDHGSLMDTGVLTSTSVETLPLPVTRCTAIAVSYSLLAAFGCKRCDRMPCRVTSRHRSARHLRPDATSTSTSTCATVSSRRYAVSHDDAAASVGSSMVRLYGAQYCKGGAGLEWCGNTKGRNYEKQVIERFASREHEVTYLAKVELSLGSFLMTVWQIRVLA